ncbi:type II secretion system protein [Prosthecobacter vanneervenii]|uniref:Prepilin-type N-terminal cleavage/methylation domain-containing protein n=1 Tax=Prosthecobacter vanneervenii TaxID=48466 RepID=A0A7W8DIX4_9BACT|nr:type II secretion system protein [Prosthecobacter vanneervenii]MBB5031266.1 prepilin-type N-terminal cleavage/methylation domain-containing protein [Prosthecobacter vanneervenii]
MKTKRNQAFTLIELLVVITIIAILASLAVPAFTMVQTQGNQMKGVNNAKQIILSLKQFSKDNNSQYPDSVPNPLTGSQAQTANDAFRYMIQEQIVTDERIFGCPAGYTPDNVIGQPPNYGNALMPGENHWAMTAGQTDTSVGNMPIVFENPATQGWPPQWNADLAGQVKPGRTWTGGAIIIGRNDGSVSVEKLSGKRGMVGPKILPGGMDSFTQAAQNIPQRVLGIIYSNNGMQSGGTAGGPGGALGGVPGMPPPAFGAPGGAPGGLPGGLPPAPGAPGLPGAPAAPGGLPPSPLGQ